MYDTGYLLSRVLTISTLLMSTSWRRSQGRIFNKQVDAYPMRYDNLHNSKRWERYDDETVEYPRYDSPPINWLLRNNKYHKMRGNKSSKNEIPATNKKQFSQQNDGLDVDQHSTTTNHMEKKTTQIVDTSSIKTVMSVTKTTSKQNLRSTEVTYKSLLPTASTTLNSHRKTFTRIQTLHGLLVKKTIYEEILEEESHESLASYATMAFLLILIMILIIFLYLAFRSKVKHKICGRKLQNRRHTLLEVVASTKLMGLKGGRDSSLLKGTRDANSSKDFKRSFRKKTLPDSSEEMRLVTAADDSEEEFSLLVPVNKIKDFRHAEA